MGETPARIASPSRLPLILTSALVVLLPALFALVTGNVWEDYLITYRASANLVSGDGLVFEAGRRIHTFTSPLGTLLPAAISAMLGSTDALAALDVFRTVSCLALGLGWLAIVPRIPGVLGMLAAGIWWAFDAKIAAFSINGMETGLLICVAMFAFRALLDQNVRLIGIAFGLSMWVRPDAFVFLGALALGCVIFRSASPMTFRQWLVAASIATAVYLPWFAWAWWYYGSPVPNTIAAKGSHLDPLATLEFVATFPFRYVFGRCVSHDMFLPTYYFFGGWPSWIWMFGKALALAAVSVVFWPRCPRVSRIAGFAFFLGGMYLTAAARAPWYFPLWQVLAFIAIAGGLTAMWEKFSARRYWRILPVAVAIGIAAVQIGFFVASCIQLRAQQDIIEWGLRAQIGHQLADASRGKQETVFLEPLGYIGYFSGLAMRDTPGLCSPEVIAIRRSGTVSMGGIIGALKPDWAVLRYAEFAGFTAGERRDLVRHYELWADHDVTARINAVSFLPGRGFLLYDAHYLVWKRRIAASEP